MFVTDREMDDSDKIDFFTEQLGGTDSKKNIRDEAFEQTGRRQNCQSPFNCDQQQTGSEEDAQSLGHVSIQSQSQVSIRPSDRNAKMNGTSEVSSDDMNKYITREKSGVTQKISAEDNVPEISQGCQNPLSIKVTDQSSDKQLMYKIKSDTPIRKVRMNVCARLGVQWDLSCLMHAGRRISSEDTPTSVYKSHRVTLKGTIKYKID